MKKIEGQKSGFLLIQVLVFGAVAVIVIAGLIALAASNIKLGRRVVLSEQAFQMAESGIEYYRWHLAHDPADYTDGTGLPGPYVKDFFDKDGNLIGTITLTITPPELGSTLVEIESRAVPAADPSIERAIVAKLAIPSFANFAIAIDADSRFGEGTEVFGPIHSNEGVRFDGIAHNIVTSALTYYDDPDHSGANEFGVHTHVNIPPATGSNSSFRSLEAPPSPVMPRPDVFLAGRSFPAPNINFSNITADLEQIEIDAQAGGLHFGASGEEGYLVVLRADDSFNLYTVDTRRSVPSGCSSSGQSGWGSWSVGNTTFLGNYPFPGNGLIFFGDHVWVEGIIDGARLTIAAANIPDSNSSLRKSITVNNDLLYTNYDGTDVIALIAQNNFNAGLFSENDLRIDAAIIAQNGRVGRFSYADNDCAPYDFRDTITLYGTLISAQRYGFRYTSDGNGYQNRNIIYDSFLLYNPPPFFPQTEDYHEIIFWQEVE